MAEAKTPARTLLRVKRRRSEAAWPEVALAAVEDTNLSKRRKRDFTLIARQESAESQDPAQALAQAVRAGQRPDRAAYEAALRRKGSGATDLRARIRENRGHRAARNRLKVLEAHRATDSKQTEPFRIIDLEPEATEAVALNGVPLERQATTDFVYDLYEAKGPPDLDDTLLDHMASVEAYGVEAVDLLMGDYRDLEDDDLLDDSEDSNAEDNWRNDYPDEEEYAEFAYERAEGSGEEDDDGAGLGLDHMNLADGDPAEEGLVYTRTMRQDANLHGSSYARYKQRVIQLLAESEDLDGSSDDD